MAWLEPIQTSEKIFEEPLQATRESVITKASRCVDAGGGSVSSPPTFENYMNKTLLISSLTLAVALAGCNDATRDAENDQPSMAAAGQGPDSGTLDPAGASAESSIGQEEITQGDAGAALQDERQALGALNAINDNEIALSNQALQKGVEGDVADFAQMMIEAHTENRERTSAMNPDASAAMAEAKKTEGEAQLGLLAGQEGDEYSRAFVEAMVEGHAKALEALDTQLIPSATTPAVAAHLRDTRGHVARHLEEAQRLHAQAGDR